MPYSQAKFIKRGKSRIIAFCWIAHFPTFAIRICGFYHALVTHRIREPISL